MVLHPNGLVRFAFLFSHAGSFFASYLAGLELFGLVCGALSPNRKTREPAQVGALLLDSHLRLMSHNSEAASILTYPQTRRQIPSLDAVLPALRSLVAGASRSAAPSSIEFTSGRRRYCCRAFVLDSGSHTDLRSRVRVVVVLERNCTRAVDISQWSAEHRLTTRERETVSFLLKGLTSEEIANEMRISPSTVKSFLKLVMVKVGASNRTGIVAKVHEETRDDQALRRRSDEVGLPGNGDHQ